MPKLNGSNSTILVTLKHCDFGAKIQNVFFSPIFLSIWIFGQILSFWNAVYLKIGFKTSRRCKLRFLCEFEDFSSS